MSRSILVSRAPHVRKVNPSTAGKRAEAGSLARSLSYSPSCPHNRKSRSDGLAIFLVILGTVQGHFCDSSPIKGTNHSVPTLLSFHTQNFPNRQRFPVVFLIIKTKSTSNSLSNPSDRFVEISSVVKGFGFVKEISWGCEIGIRQGAERWRSLGGTR